MAVTAYTLFSSSKGNCSYFSDGETSFLIDAGGSGKRIISSLCSLGASPCGISDIFITHEHEDHIKGLPGFCKKSSPVIHAVMQSARDITVPNVAAHDRIYTVKLGAFTVKSFATSHDSKCSVGYIIEHESGIKLGSMTDTGHVSGDMLAALDGCCAVILESNYDEDMLKYGGYPEDVKRRIASDKGHLSNAQSAEALAYLYKSGTRRVLLAHISPENNTPDLALDSALSAVKRYGLDMLDVAPADRYGITKLI